MTKQATYIPTNSTITVVAVNGGWTTIKFADGTEKKVRNGEISGVVVGPDRRQPESKKETAKMETQAAEAKKPTPPVRPAPAPAHFVGDVAPGKVAKIKDTKFDLSRYYVSDTKTPTGRRTIDCADDVAAQLRGLPIDEVYEHAAEATGIDVALLKVTYGHLNVGMQRMSLGNRIRGNRIRGAAKAREQEAAKAKREAAAKERAEKLEAEKAQKTEAKAKREAEAQAAKEAADKARAEAKAKKEAEALAKKSAKLAEKAKKTAAA